MLIERLSRVSKLPDWSQNMPDNKNQHYVPRCHLKPFSLNREGLAINLFNHSRGIIRQNVPVGGQCAKSYFYGEDLVVERLLQGMEGKYASTVRNVEGGQQLSDSDVGFLRSFTFLQWCRTDAALRRRREVMTALEEMVIRGMEGARVEPPDLSQKSMILGSLGIWAKSQNAIDDLGVVILRNQTRVDFVTSDDPAVVTNRVFLQKMQNENFGIWNAGLLIMMPLGPHHAVVFYDRDSYRVEGRVGRYVDVRRDQDARAFNESQYLNSLHNIYFSGSSVDGGHIKSSFDAISHRRLQDRFRTWVGIKDSDQNGLECYRQLRDGEKFDPRAPRIMSFAPLYPCPIHWISKIKMRSGPVGWVRPGTVIGPVRRGQAQRLGDMRQVKIGIGPAPYLRASERMYLRSKRLPE